MTAPTIRPGSQADASSRASASSPRTSADSLEELLSMPLLGEDSYEMGDRRARAGAPPDLESQLILRRLEGRSRWRLPNTAQVQRLQHALATVGSRMRCCDCDDYANLALCLAGLGFGCLGLLFLLNLSTSSSNVPADKNATAAATASILSATLSLPRQALASATARHS